MTIARILRTVRENRNWIIYNYLTVRLTVLKPSLYIYFKLRSSYFKHFFSNFPHSIAVLFSNCRQCQQWNKIASKHHFSNIHHAFRFISNKKLLRHEMIIGRNIKIPFLIRRLQYLIASRSGKRHKISRRTFMNKNLHKNKIWIRNVERFVRKCWSRKLLVRYYNHFCCFPPPRALSSSSG